ncbi:MAG: CoA ester lyase [Pseudomonadota bacterium]
MTGAPLEAGLRPRRSALYMPASKARALDKARALAADVLLFDLEDAVAPGEKAAARDLLVAALAEGGYAPRETVIRVNGPNTPWGVADIVAAATAGADAVLLPKVEGAAAIEAAAAALDAAGGPPGLALWAMIETPRGVLAAGEIAAHPRLACLVAGTNDLLAELQARFSPDRAALMPALTQVVLAARAHGKAVLDGVYNAYGDDAGLEIEARQGRMLGMDGKTLIHPRQLAIANRLFAPDAEAVDRARAEVEAFEAATARGEGIAVLDGRIVENLHAAAARRLIAQAEAIAALEAATA